MRKHCTSPQPQRIPPSTGQEEQTQTQTEVQSKQNQTPQAEAQLSARQKKKKRQKERKAKEAAAKTANELSGKSEAESPGETSAAVVKNGNAGDSSLKPEESKSKEVILEEERAFYAEHGSFQTLSFLEPHKIFQNSVIEGMSDVIVTKEYIFHDFLLHGVGVSISKKEGWLV